MRRALILTLTVALFMADKFPLWTWTLTITKGHTHNVKL